MDLCCNLKFKDYQMPRALVTGTKLLKNRVLTINFANKALKTKRIFGELWTLDF